MNDNKEIKTVELKSEIVEAANITVESVEETIITEALYFYNLDFLNFSSFFPCLNRCSISFPAPTILYNLHPFRTRRAAR